MDSVAPNGIQLFRCLLLEGRYLFMMLVAADSHLMPPPTHTCGLPHFLMSLVITCLMALSTYPSLSPGVRSTPCVPMPTHLMFPFSPTHLCSHIFTPFSHMLSFPNILAWASALCASSLPSSTSKPRALLRHPICTGTCSPSLLVHCREAQLQGMLPLCKELSQPLHEPDHQLLQPPSIAHPFPCS